MRKLFGSGNSVVVTLPPDVLDVFNLTAGDEVSVVADLDQGCIILDPKTERVSGAARRARDLGLTIRSAADTSSVTLDYKQLQVCIDALTTRTESSLVESARLAEKLEDLARTCFACAVVLSDDERARLSQALIAYAEPEGR